MIKKKKISSSFSKQVINVKIGDPGLKILEKAWNNLPYDMGSDEKFVFIEVVEKIVKGFKEFSRTSEFDDGKN